MKKENKALVSIITATYNSEKFITETYQSIKSQTLDNWEWLITDDASSDNTMELIRELQKNDDRIQIYENPINSGAAVSRNNSIAKATGDYLAFIDSDDIWKPEKLKIQIEFMKKNSANFTFTAYELIDQSGNQLHKTVDTKQVGNFTYKDMLKKKATLGCSTVMLRRDYFPDLYMPLIRTGQDYALWLKLLKSSTDAIIIPKVLTKYRIHSNSISRNKVAKAKRQWEIYRKLEKLNRLDALVCFIFYVKRAIFKQK